ncbi:hypothetical protein pb186bvf_001905 [Paramecium bursaria]
MPSEGRKVDLLNNFSLLTFLLYQNVILQFKYYISFTFGMFKQIK